MVAPVAPVAAHLLPPQLRALVRLCGVTDTLALLGLWGGQRHRLAERPQDCPESLRQALSDAGLAALCASPFGGQATDWPKSDKILRQWTHAAMCEERRSGATANALAARYGYTERRVRSIAPLRPAGEADALQLVLFDDSP